MSVSDFSPKSSRTVLSFKRSHSAWRYRALAGYCLHCHTRCIQYTTSASPRVATSESFTRAPFSLRCRLCLNSRRICACFPTAHGRCLQRALLIVRWKYLTGTMSKISAVCCIAFNQCLPCVYPSHAGRHCYTHTQVLDGLTGFHVHRWTLTSTHAH